MMEKDLLAEGTAEVLRQAGFAISARCYLRPRSFDLAARRGEILLLLKILSNIDGLNEKTALEINRLSKHLEGNPLLIGEKTRDQYLETGAVYFRYGIPTVNLSTLADCLIDGSPPLVYAAHGGLYVRINGSLMRSLRLERGISLGSLASEIGVSRRTISKYEIEDMDTSVDVALKLEEVFERELIEPVDIFASENFEDEPSLISNDVLRMLNDIGFQVFPIDQAPFNAVTRDQSLVVLTGVSKFSQGLAKKARLMSSLSAVAKTRSAVIIEGEAKVECIEETAIIGRAELEGIGGTSEFESLVLEKRSTADFDEVSPLN